MGALSARGVRIVCALSAHGVRIVCALSARGVRAAATTRTWSAGSEPLSRAFSVPKMRLLTLIMACMSIFHVYKISAVQ